MRKVSLELPVTFELSHLINKFIIKMQRNQPPQSLCPSCSRWVETDQIHHHMRLCDNTQSRQHSHSHTPHGHSPNRQPGFHTMWPGHTQQRPPTPHRPQESLHMLDYPTPPQSQQQQGGGSWLSWLWGGNQAQGQTQTRVRHPNPEIVR